MLIIENYEEAAPGTSLIASFDVYLPAAELRLRKLKVMKGKNGPWIAFPSFKDAKDAWIPYFSFSEERNGSFVSEVRNLLKEYMRS